MYLENILILMPLILIIGGIIYGITESNKYLFLISFGMILCLIISEIFKKFMPKTGKYLRPINDKCKCTICPSSCPNSSEVGMPSTHAATMIFFVTLIFLKDKSINYKVIISLIIAFLVIYQRYSSNCHNFEQLLMGSFLGFILGLFYKNFFMDKID